MWKIEVVGYDRFRERELESWFTVANGRTGTRGALEEGSPESNPSVYVAGVFGRLPDSAAGPVPLVGPTWTSLLPRVLGVMIRLEAGELLEHRRVLDLQQGILFRIWRQRLPSGTEVTFRSARFASLANRALLAMEAEAHSSNGLPVTLSGDIPLPSTPALEHVTSTLDDHHLRVELTAARGGRAAFSITTKESESRVERIVAMSRAGPGSEMEGSQVEALKQAETEGFGELRRHHRDAWAERWQASDVIVEGDPAAQLSLRFALYHLISAGDPHSDLASIGARALTGPGYNGHVFWDTDVFMLPFFLHTQPEVARRLIGYRFKALPAARARARKLGYRGALYAWESADDGEDCTPQVVIGLDGTIVPVLTGLEEHHISADVAWAAWRYWEATRDEDFLVDTAAEIILETARFWASRARRGRDGRHHIAPVIGPDEYHESVRNNAFTNLLARWNLERGLDVAELLAALGGSAWATLADRIDVRPGELQRWRAVAEGLVHRFDPDTLLYEQFDGYFRLENIVAAGVAPRPFAADVVLGRERVHRSQVIKQADVVMLMHVLGDAFPRDVVLANYRYYEPRTSHGSSLSPAVHAVVAARAGLSEEALSYFRMSASIDLDDGMGNAAQGIHMAAAAGLWQAAVFGFGGVRPEGECLRIDPHLPDSWSRLAFPFTWRGGALCVKAAHSQLEIELDADTVVALGDGSPRRLAAGNYRSGRDGQGWSAPVEVKGP
ncbi:MAG: glycoside hydrolase family 65 [Candidatus Dormibacteraeota bacterium]|nr:glycoside hydrolase family 65 [Candidatus Dormibacteraeota bacterium]